MIKIQQLKLQAGHSEEDLKKKLIKSLHIKEQELISFSVLKKSIDARKKPEIFFVYTLEASITGEKAFLKRNRNPDISISERPEYRFPEPGSGILKERPVIAGSGPCGLFCALELAKHGYSPLIVERGSSVEKRKEAVRQFWQTGILNKDTNVQFGEGGAGTFSDGKLNTLVKDNFGRNREVLSVFVEMGAPAEILYESKPHIGTDILAEVLVNLRKEIIRLGGEFCFDTCITDIRTEDGTLRAIELNHEKWLPAQVLVLAIGHSARDTFELLHKKGLAMEAKSFAVGMRVEHPQSMIDLNQYGTVNPEILPPSPYKVTAKGKNGRGVYSFCMCPGGYVVNASSEENRLAVNGMSYYRRDSANANSAIIVAVTPEDYPKEGPLSGMYFQRMLEEKAYALCNGKIPQQLYGDYKKGTPSLNYGDFISCVKGEASLTDLSSLFPVQIKEAFIDGMEAFDRKIPGFSGYDTILSGVESRTSSPVRIERDASFQGSIKGIFPAGEGAGFAGGIMSAAMDGMKTAEVLAAFYRPLS